MQFVAFYAAAQDTGALLPGATVSVYQATDPPQTTLADLFNEEGAGIGNPLIAGNSGLVGFAAADGDYDVVVYSGAEAQPSFKLYLLDPADIGASVAAAQSAADGAAATATEASQTAGQATQTLSQIEQTVSDAQAQVAAAQQDASDALNQVAEANTSLLSSIANAQGQAQSALLQVADNTANLVTVSATVDANTAAITNNYATLTTSISSLSGTISTLSATVTTNNSTQSANLTSEAVTRADADSALSSSITTLASTVGSNTASISSNYTTLTSSISALSSTVTSLSSTVGSNTASITANYGALSGLLSTQAAQITTLQSNYGSLSSTVGSNYTSLSTAQSTTAAIVTTLQSRSNPGSNLLPYGNFEAGTTGWTGFGTGATVPYADPNYGSLCYVGVGVANGYIVVQSAPFPLTAGQNYTKSGNIQALQNPGPGTAPNCYLDLIYLNSSMAQVGDGGNNKAQYTLNSPTSGPNYTHTEVAPAGTAYGVLRFVITPSGAGIVNQGWLQKIKVEQGTVATPYTAEQTAVNVSASITSEAVTRSTADSALSSSITSLTTTVGSNTSTISSNYTSLTSSINSLSSTVSSLSSTVSGHTASISSQQTAISTLQSQTAIYVEEVSTSGGNTIVQLISSSTGGTSILLQSNKVFFGAGIVADETTGTIRFIGSPNDNVLGEAFGASSNLLQWSGPTGTAISAMTKANAVFYIATDGTVGGSGLSSGANAFFITGTGSGTASTSSPTQLAQATFTNIPGAGYYNLTATAVVAGGSRPWSGSTVSANGTWQIVEFNPAATAATVLVSGTWSATYSPSNGTNFSYSVGNGQSYADTAFTDAMYMQASAKPSNYTGAVIVDLQMQTLSSQAVNFTQAGITVQWIKAG
jgi:hypothetical protein